MIVAAFFTLPASVARADCDLTDAGPATIVEILNTESLLLEDGRTIRLAGVLSPRTRARWAGSLGIEERLMAALRDGLVGRKVRLRFGGRKRDRYGRLLVHVFRDSAESPEWMQRRLVRDGVAMAVSYADNRACARRLQAFEKAARENGAGFWRDGIFRLRDAANPASMSSLSYSFQIVRGQVRDVAEKNRRVYINFGENWRTDFTATIAPSDRDAFAESDIKPSELKGKHVRVRGWLERRNGPMIDVTHPEQIEIVAPTDSASVEER